MNRASRLTYVCYTDNACVYIVNQNDIDAFEKSKTVEDRIRNSLEAKTTGGIVLKKMTGVPAQNDSANKYNQPKSSAGTLVFGK